MSRPRVTIDEISKRTGLSRGTVSRALNDRADISAATKERVLSECRKLNFSPSPTARALATGRSFTVGLLIGDDVAGGFVADVLAGAVRRAAQSGYLVVVAHAPTDGATNVIESLADRRVDGLLLAAPLPAAMQETIRSVFGPAGRIVALFEPGVAEWDSVVPDHRAAGRLAATHLLSGFSGAAMFVRDSDTADLDEGWNGFRDACRERGLEPEAVSSDEIVPADVRLARAAAIAAASDFAALKTISCLGNARRLGDEVGVIGLGNERFANSTSPRLSSVDMNGGEAGARAVELLIQRIASAGAPTGERIRIAPRLAARESTGAVSAAG